MRTTICNCSLLSDKRFLALVATFFAGMGQGLVSPEMPDLIGSQAASLALTVGGSAFLLYAGIFFASFRFSNWADRGRVNRLLTGGLWAYAATLLGFALHPSLSVLMVLRFAEGISISAILVSADYLLGRLSEEKERGLWLSFYGVALSIGLLIGPVVTIFFGLQVGLTAVAGASLLLSLLSLSPIRISTFDVKKGDLGFSPPLLIASLYGFLEASLVALVPLIALEYFHQKPQWILVAAILSAALASIPLGMLGDRFKPRRIVILLLVFLAFGNLFYSGAWSSFSSFGSSLTLIFSVPIFFGILCGGFYPLGFAWLLEGYSSEHYGLASGRFTRYYGAGSLVGPVLLSFVYERFHLTGFFLFLSLFGFGLWATIYFWRRNTHEVR